MPYLSFNPWLQKRDAGFPEMSDSELGDILDESERLFHEWRRSDVAGRCSRLTALSSVLLSRRSGLAEMMAVEMGKPVTQGMAEIDKCTVAVNGFVKTEPGLPFGGVRESGYGRELGVEGLREFMNIKTVNIF